MSNKTEDVKVAAQPDEAIVDEVAVEEDFDLDAELVIEVDYMGVRWATRFPALSDERFGADIQKLIKERQVFKGRRMVDQGMIFASGYILNGHRILHCLVMVRP